MEISLRTLIPPLLFRDQSPVAQRVQMTVAKCSLTSFVWACFGIGSHTLPGQRHSRPTLTSLGQECTLVLGVTCHLHFWQNDRGLLRATKVTREVVQTLNKCQHTKFTLEKKILPPFLPRFELATFWSPVWHSYQQAIPAPRTYNKGLHVVELRYWNGLITKIAL